MFIEANETEMKNVLYCGDSSYPVFDITEFDCKTSVCCITGTKVKSSETREYNMIDSDVTTIFKYFEKHT